MKPKFAYLYIAFIISLLIVVILSFVFYTRLNLHLRYTKQSAASYSVILNIRELEERMVELENYSRGYQLVPDSIFLIGFENSKDSAMLQLEELGKRLTKDREQLQKFQLMRSTIMNQINTYTININRAGFADSGSIDSGVKRGAQLMDSFRSDAQAIETAENKKINEKYESKEFFEEYYPNFFNSISIWAGIITLVSFFFINREVRMRSRYQLELEKKLQELNRSNSELKQFAYVASHDLQEPLRKIRTFSDKLVFKHKDNLDGESGVVITRIEASARRMQELIHDMVNFTSLVNREDRLTNVDLNNVITETLKDYSDISKERHAIISWDKMPVIKGSNQQLSLLFRSLFDNAFKFAKPDESPEIRITYKLISGEQEEQLLPGKRNYHKIIMEDKGIGFNNEFAEKIFMIFQRLHTQQSGYRGKGIGLAIAQRIMTNHNGMITAHGSINDGAIFYMYFPAEN